MGVLCLNGTGMPQSGKEAANFFYEAAKLGNSEAQFRYAMVLEQKVHKERRQEAERIAQAREAAERAASRKSGSEDESSEGEVEEVEDSEEESDDDIFGTQNVSEVELEPLQPSDVRGSVAVLLGQSLHWLIKAADKSHGLAQHKAALLYMLGVEPVDPDKENHGPWHMRPSVVTWGKSCVHALLVGEARPFSRNPSVVTWNIAMKEKEVEIGPNLEKAAEWHEKAANNGMLSSAYAIAIAKETGRGTHVALEEAFEWYKIAATGQLADSEGSMQGVEYICPHCLAWNPNRRTKETPKGNNRCRQCKEERYFPKDLLVKDPLAGIVRTVQLDQTTCLSCLRLRIPLTCELIQQILSSMMLRRMTKKTAEKPR
jgi:TPR repeat protein